MALGMRVKMFGLHWSYQMPVKFQIFSMKIISKIVCLAQSHQNRHCQRQNEFVGHFSHKWVSLLAKTKKKNTSTSLKVSVHLLLQAIYSFFLYLFIETDCHNDVSHVKNEKINIYFHGTITIDIQ